MSFTSSLPTPDAATQYVSVFFQVTGPACLARDQLFRLADQITTQQLVGIILSMAKRGRPLQGSDATPTPKKAKKHTNVKKHMKGKKTKKQMRQEVMRLAA